MKTISRFLILFLIVISGFLLYNCQKEERTTQSDPNVVSEEQALSIANNIVSDETGSIIKLFKSRLKSTKSDEVKSITTQLDSKAKPTCYIINYEDGGFLVLSADNRISPILAFSEDNSFPTDSSEYQPGTNIWLNDVKCYIEAVRKNNVTQDELQKKEWENLITPKRSSRLKNIDPEEPNCNLESVVIDELLSTKWGQGCGYNSLLPLLSSIKCTDPYYEIQNCSHVLTGCVPLAMAQVMKYYQYPSSFSWASMPNTTYSNETARLLKTLNDVLPMEYHCYGSGVYTEFNKANIFKNYYQYRYADQGNYNLNTVEQNLIERKPVLLGARNQYGEGHMWVCDGLQQNMYCDDDGTGFMTEYLHMNWGADGIANGWFVYDNFNPVFNNITYNFNYSKYMVYNIKP